MPPVSNASNISISTYGDYATISSTPCLPSAPPIWSGSIPWLVFTVISFYVFTIYFAILLTNEVVMWRLRTTPSYELFKMIEGFGKTVWAMGRDSRYLSVTHTEDLETQKRVIIVVENMEEIPRRAREKETAERSTSDEIRRVVLGRYATEDELGNNSLRKTLSSLKLGKGRQQVTTALDGVWESSSSSSDGSQQTGVASASVPTRPFDSLTESSFGMPQTFRNRITAEPAIAIPPPVFEQPPAFNVESSPPVYIEDGRRRAAQHLRRDRGEPAQSIGFAPYPW